MLAGQLTSGPMTVFAASLGKVATEEASEVAVVSASSPPSPPSYEPSTPVPSSTSAMLPLALSEDTEVLSELELPDSVMLLVTEPVFVLELEVDPLE